MYKHILLLTLVGMAASTSAIACDLRASITAQSQIEHTLQTLKKVSAQQDALFELRLRNKAQAESWTAQQQENMRKLALSSDSYWELEEQKQPYISELSEAIMSSSGPAPRISMCRAAQRVKAASQKLTQLNARQHELALLALAPPAHEPK